MAGEHEGIDAKLVVDMLRYADVTSALNQSFGYNLSNSRLGPFREHQVSTREESSVRSTLDKDFLGLPYGIGYALLAAT